jgi:hypothetical protein
VVIERHRGRDVLAVEARDQEVKGGVIRPGEAARWQTEDAQALRRFSGRFRAFPVSVPPSLCGRLRFDVEADNTRSRFAGALAGATGLEPATSSVTGRRSDCPPLVRNLLATGRYTALVLGMEGHSSPKPPGQARGIRGVLHRWTSRKPASGAGLLMSRF